MEAIEVDCTLCQSVFTKPIELQTCSHVMCKECIDSCIENQVKNKAKELACPLCRKVFTKNDLVSAVEVVEHLETNSRECDCGAMINLLEYNKH